MLQLIADLDPVATTLPREERPTWAPDPMVESLDSATTASPRSLLQAIEPLLAQAGPFGNAPCAAPLVQRRLRAWHGAAALHGSCLTMLADTDDDGLDQPEVEVSPFGTELSPDIW